MKKHKGAMLIPRLGQHPNRDAASRPIDGDHQMAIDGSIGRHSVIKLGDSVSAGPPLPFLLIYPLFPRFYRSVVLTRRVSGEHGSFPLRCNERRSTRNRATLDRIFSSTRFLNPFSSPNQSSFNREIKILCLPGRKVVKVDQSKGASTVQNQSTRKNVFSCSEKRVPSRITEYQSSRKRSELLNSCSIKKFDPLKKSFQFRPFPCSPSWPFLPIL